VHANESYILEKRSQAVLILEVISFSHPLPAIDIILFFENYHQTSEIRATINTRTKFLKIGGGGRGGRYIQPEGLVSRRIRFASQKLFSLQF